MGFIGCLCLETTLIGRDVGMQCQIGSTCNQEWHPVVNDLYQWTNILENKCGQVLVGQSLRLHRWSSGHSCASKTSSQFL